MRMMTRLWTTLVAALSLAWGASAFGQGAAVIMPLSKTSLTPDETIVFFIHNRLDGDLSLKYLPKCDIDGKEQEGDICLTAFNLVLDTKVQDGKLLIAKGGKVKGEVKLKRQDLRFALFKPLFTPILEEVKKANSVSFDFGYQPGYLFVVKPEKERLEKIVFDTYVVDKTRRARMKIDIGSLSMPQVVSVSAKILDRPSKKLVRFMRLASDKIVDPKRGQLELEGEFAEASDKQDVCYQIFVEGLTTKEFYTLEDCK